jgi:hypothetical protein
MKKRHSYYDVICSELNIFNDPALAYGNTKAWANRKAKAYKKIVPRGKVFSRLHKQEWNAVVKAAKSLSTKWQKIET